MFSWPRFVCVLTLAGICLGCGGGGPPAQTTATVTGEVQKKGGGGVGGVSVIFHPEKGQPVVTKTDDAGKFTVQAPVGNCKVAVIAQADAPPDSSPGAAKAVLEKASKVNAKYANPDTSGLTATVKASQSDKVVFVVE